MVHSDFGRREAPNARTPCKFRMAFPRRFLAGCASHKNTTRMNVLKPLTTPAYFFRPRQIVHRFKRALRRAPLGQFETVVLPWGAQLRIRPSEVIGSNIWCYGIFDLVVCEAICRLLDPSETALDIGANVGQMTSLMRCRVGKKGRVVAFEPHPELFSELRHNMEGLQAPEAAAAAELHNVALSDVVGEALLEEGPAWADNRGVSKLVSAGASTERAVAVKTAVLDEMFDGRTAIGLCKMDVEGHELQVLKGAARLLRERRVRDIIFEELDAYPSPVHQVLLDSGFTIFSLHSRLWKPLLAPALQRVAFNRGVDGVNFLATLDPQRAVQRFEARGWRGLRSVNG
jgi:FkbM family methyltransferase